jgi:serine/threonine-protein kinase SRPK3
MIELLGRVPCSVSSNGKHAKEYLTKEGETRHIRKLNFWPIERVLMEKYHFSANEVGF